MTKYLIHHVKREDVFYLPGTTYLDARHLPIGEADYVLEGDDDLHHYLDIHQSSAYSFYQEPRQYQSKTTLHDSLMVFPYKEGDPVFSGFGTDTTVESVSLTRKAESE